MKTTKQIIFDLIFHFSEYNEFGGRTHTMRSNIVKACRAFGVSAKETNNILGELIETGVIEKIDINVDGIDYPVAAYKQLYNNIQ
jgi:hypothetical protein